MQVRIMKLDGWQIPLATIVGVVAGSAYFKYPADTSEAVAAWVQALGSIAAILAAVWVAHRQYEQTRQLELDRIAAATAAENAETRAFVQAVRQELASIWDGYSTGIRPVLLAVEEDEFFDALVPVHTDAFTVFNNASPQVGKVPDEELRRLIVTTYARAKGHIYSLQMNSALINDFTNFAVMHRGENHERVLEAKKNVLVNYAAQMRVRDAQLEQYLQKLLARADEWLQSCS
jgi:hypothetical protein